VSGSGQDFEIFDLLYVKSPINKDHVGLFRKSDIFTCYEM